jgi:NhaP-type Na+/H+ or K+/H+ antiporter
MVRALVAPFVAIVAWIAAIALVAPRLSAILAVFGKQSTDPELLAVFLAVSTICTLSFISYYLSRGAPFPSFVIALFLGIAAHPLLAPIVENHVALAAIVSLGATLILFQGGLETSFKEFRRLFIKIMLLAFPGVVISALLLSGTITGTAVIAGTIVPVTVAVLLGAILASTDPAAIIPLLQGLKFKNNTPKDIVVSESAMNDVVGALLTLALVGAALLTPFTSIIGGYATLISPESGALLIMQMAFGILAGVGGYALLRYLSAHKKDHGFEHGADAAFFILVPVIAFAAALEFGGSGYLAAFIAGLIFNLSPHLAATEHFFNSLIDGFAKPAIFLLLGALVVPSSLIHYAPIGIAAALIFMFVIRPLMVFLMLGIFIVLGKNRLSVRELLFISFVRETGAIPAVLLVTVSSLGLADMEALVPIGMWVILATLVIQPPFTPWLARRLKLVE